METMQVKIFNLQLDVDFTYEPAQEERMYMNNGDPGEPGSPETYEIEKVIISNIDITDLIFESDKTINLIIDKIKEKRNEQT